MIVKVLVENNRINNKYKKKHGLSLYIESNNQKLLFDLGPNDYFYHNAKKMAVDIQNIDSVIISHGHLDHGGGLESFLMHNQQANIYIQPDAFKRFYAKFLRWLKANVGLDNNLKHKNQIHFTSDIYKLNPTMTLFTTNVSLFPTSPLNDSLYVTDSLNDYKDIFSHEQSLIVEEDGRLFLFAGCAHKGIVNIINQAKNITNKDIDFVFSGFHLSNPITKKTVSSNYMDQLTTELGKFNTVYYTCHCTGSEPYNILKENLDDKIHYIKTGDEIDL